MRCRRAGGSPRSNTMRQLPAFLADLGGRDGLAARCSALTILTACRTGEAIGATWQEIDEEGRL